MSIISNFPVKGLPDINGLIEEYKVKTGEIVDVGDFVKFVNETYNEMSYQEVEKVLTETSGTGLTYPGAASTFNTGNINFASVARLTDNTAVISFRDVGGNTGGCAVVATVSNGNITFGSKFVFNSGQTEYITTAKIDTNKVLVVFRSVSGVSYSILTINETTITGTTVSTLKSINATYLSLTPISDNKLLLAHNTSGSTGTASVLTVNGNALLTGSDFTFSNANATHITTTKLTDSSVFIAYTANNKGYCHVLNITDTSMTYKTEYVFSSEAVSYISSLAITTNKVLISYRKNLKTNVQLLNIDGSDTITSVVENELHNGAGGWITLSELYSNKVIVTYTAVDSTNTGYGFSKILTVGDASITQTNPYQIGSDKLNFSGIAKLSNNKILVAFASNATSGKALVLSENLAGEIVTGYYDQIIETPVIKYTYEGTGNTYTGTPATINSTMGDSMHAAKLDNSRILLTYNDPSNNNSGTAVVLTISNGNISVGSKFVYMSGNTSYNTIAVLSSTRALIAYRNLDNGQQGVVALVNISNTTISLVTSITFNTSSTWYISMATMNESTVLVTFTNLSNAYSGTAMVLTVSGNSITRGTPVVYNSGYTYFNKVNKLSNNRFIVTYTQVSNFNSIGINVLTVSGTNVIVGTQKTLPGSSSEVCNAVLNEHKAIVTFADGSLQNAISAYVLNISGNNIVNGDKVVINSNRGSSQLSINKLVDNKVIVAFRNGGDGFNGNANVLTIDRNNISVGKTFIFNQNNTEITSIATIGNDSVLLSYRNANTTSSPGMAMILSENSSGELFNGYYDSIKKVMVTDSEGNPVYETYMATELVTIEITEKRVAPVYIKNDMVVERTSVVAPVNFSENTNNYYNINISPTKDLVVCRNDSSCHAVTYDNIDNTLVQNTDSDIFAGISETINNLKISATKVSDDSVLISYYYNNGNGTNTKYGLTLIKVTESGIDIVDSKQDSLNTTSDVLLGANTILLTTNTVIGHYYINGESFISVTTVNDTGIVGRTAYQLFVNKTMYGSSVSKLTDSTFLISYVSSEGYGVANLVTYTGTGVTVGDDFVFNPETTSLLKSVNLSENNVLAVYKNMSHSSLYASLLTIIDGNIVEQQPFIFNPAESNMIDLIKVDESTVLVSYSDGTNNYAPTIIVLTIKDNIIYRGQTYLFDTNLMSHVACSLLNDYTLSVAYTPLNTQTGTLRLFGYEDAVITDTVNKYSTMSVNDVINGISIDYGEGKTDPNLSDTVRIYSN